MNRAGQSNSEGGYRHGVAYFNCFFLLMAEKPVSDLGAAGDAEEVECVLSLGVRTHGLGVEQCVCQLHCYFLDSDLGKGLPPLPLLGVRGGGAAVTEVAWELISNADLRPPGAPCA